jgi:hypothetical protein
MMNEIILLGLLHGKEKGIYWSWRLLFYDTLPRVLLRIKNITVTWFMLALPVYLLLFSKSAISMYHVIDVIMISQTSSPFHRYISGGISTADPISHRKNKELK